MTPKENTKSATPKILEEKSMTRDGAEDVLRPMRARCWKAGHCLGLTVETDCNLFPVRRGWCRKRV